MADDAPQGGNEMPVEVLRKEYAEAKADMLKYKQQVKEFQDKLTTFEKTAATAKEAELAEQQKFKELAETRQKELEAERKKASELQAQFDKQKLHSAVSDELKKRGINADPAWIPVDSIDNIAKAVEQFEQQYPHLKSNNPPTHDTRKPPITTSERWWMKPNPTNEEFNRMTTDQYAEWRKAHGAVNSAFGTF